MNEKELGYWRGQAINIAKDIIINNLEKTSLDYLIEHPEHQEKIINELFKLGKKIFNEGLRQDINNWKQKENKNETTSKQCPKCGDEIPISLINHYKCGWQSEKYKEL